jgi:hypothetical protein
MIIEEETFSFLNRSFHSNSQNTSTRIIRIVFSGTSPPFSQDPWIRYEIVFLFLKNMSCFLFKRLKFVYSNKTKVLVTHIFFSAIPTSSLINHHCRLSTHAFNNDRQVIHDGQDWTFTSITPILPCKRQSNHSSANAPSTRCACFLYDTNPN